jgi:hypothetical protein
MHAKGVREILDPITINAGEIPPYMACVQYGPEEQWMLSIMEDRFFGFCGVSNRNIPY